MGSQSTQENRTTGWAERGGWEGGHWLQCRRVAQTRPEAAYRVKASAHQSRSVLVWPEGLGDGPVSDGNARLWVWPHVDEFMAAVPRLEVEIWLHKGVCGSRNVITLLRYGHFHKKNEHKPFWTLHIQALSVHITLTSNSPSPTSGGSGPVFSK